ncbi:hypothetical protein D9619_005371 [Psilocybe cf. subviscida]|uniref:Protein kinase domain-containing protein n=1 Tax=Psilocybe cf. subviscida TaxID=2480587 RepID=A0A8H5BX88_9AGAR|nr:hypothetical protein D9619_005371 [Psilocybe cf. subviscida]
MPPVALWASRGEQDKAKAQDAGRAGRGDRGGGGGGGGTGAGHSVLVMAHARRSPQHRAPPSSASSPSTTRRHTLRRGSHRQSAHTTLPALPDDVAAAPLPKTQRPVLVPLHPNLRRLPSRVHLAPDSKAEDSDCFMRDSGHVIAGSKRKRAVSTNENAHNHGRPTGGLGSRKRLRTTSALEPRWTQTTTDESESDSSMEVDATSVAAVDSDNSERDSQEEQSEEDDDDETDSSDSYLINFASASRLGRLLKADLIRLYHLLGLPDDAELLTKAEIVECVINARDDIASVPPSSPQGGTTVATSSEGSSDEGRLADEEEVDDLPVRNGPSGSQLRRRVSHQEVTKSPMRPLKSRSLSMGNVLGLGEPPKPLLTKRNSSSRSDVDAGPSTRRRVSTRSSPTTSATQSGLNNAFSPPAKHLRSRHVSTAFSTASSSAATATTATTTAATSRGKTSSRSSQGKATSSKGKAVPLVSATTSSRGKGKGKAKQVEFNKEVEVRVRSPSRHVSASEPPRLDFGSALDGDSDLTELDDTDVDEHAQGAEGEEVKNFTEPSPRRLRSKDRREEQNSNSKGKQKESDPQASLTSILKPQSSAGSEQGTQVFEGATGRQLRVTPLRKAKGRIGGPMVPTEGDEINGIAEEDEDEDEEALEEEDGEPAHDDGVEVEDVEDVDVDDEDEVDELVSSASVTPPPPEPRGRRTPVRTRLRPRRPKGRPAPTVDEENEGDDEDEADDDDDENVDRDDSQERDSEEEDVVGEADEAEEDEDDNEEDAEVDGEVGDDSGTERGDEEEDDESTIAVEPRKLRNGKIVGETDVEMEVDEESIGDDDEADEQEDAEEGEAAEEAEADAESETGESVDMDAEVEEDEAMDEEVDLTVATAKTLVRLRRDDLVRLCETREIDPSGTKPQLAEALLQWRDRQTNDFSSPSSAGTVRPSSVRRKRKTTTTTRQHQNHHTDETDTAVPVLLRPESEQEHTDEPRTPVPDMTSKEKEKEEELELDLESLGLDDREIPPEKLVKQEKIGSGGFKDVYIGKFKGRKIAISEFRGHLSAMDIKELKLLGEFNHPNIVRFLGVSIPENTKETPVMIVSELCSNGDLFDYIRNVNAPPMRKVLSIMHDIASGLEYLHTRKPSVIHRDCKSSNILITAKGTAKIADFGLAKVKQSTRSMVRSLVGTVNWQAPELWTAHPKYNHKVDVFSCAMVFWEMLQWHVSTKKFPWEGMNEHAIYEVVGAKRQRPPTASLKKQWGNEIVELIEHMWAQEHQNRPTMTEVVRALEDIQTRSISTVGYEDMPKLRAFPFAKTPEEAQRHMSIVGGIMLAASPGKVLKSLLAGITESSFFPHIQPTKFSAAYFPAWIVNGETLVDISYKGSQVPSELTSRWTCYSHTVGSHMPVLSAASLWSESLEDAESVPFSRSLLHQHGEDVQCIPFSVSPFALLDAAKSSDSLRYSTDLSFSPNSIKSNFFSASPVLIPVYIARYEDDGTSMTNRHMPPVAVITPGLDADWTTIVEGAAFTNDRIGNLLKKVMLQDEEVIRDAETVMVTATSRVNGSIPALRFRGYETDQVFEELNDQLSYSANISKLASARNLVDDLKDPRIREHTEEEVGSVEKYFDFRLKAVEFGFVKNTIGSLNLPEGVKITTQLDEIASAEKDVTPKWWTEYQASSDSKSKEE